MRCLKCDYPLWDLSPGNCPECGEPFDPTTHQFRPGVVRFCCPECDQSYYGDGEGGHLRPSRFKCIKCDRTIDESECIVRPREDGSHEDLIVPESSPWHDRTLSGWNRFWGTVGQSMVRPGKLGRGLPAQLSLGSSYLFVSIIYGLILLLGLAPMKVFTWFINNPGGGAPNFTWVSEGLDILLFIPGVLVVLTVYATISHGLLRLTGRTTGGIGRTIASMGFGLGPMIFAVLPCLGPNCLQFPAGIWAMVSAILILIPSQGVSGIRSSIAVLTPLLVGITIGVALLVYTVETAANNFAALAANPLPGQILIPGNLDPGPPLEIGDATVRFRCSVIVDRVAKSRDLPTFKELMEDPEVLFSSNVKPLEVTSTSFQGVGYQGWWIPGMMVVKGADGAFLVTVNDVSGMSSENSESYSIYRQDRLEHVFALPASNQEIVTELRQAIEEVGGDGLQASTVDAWVSASVSRETGFQMATLRVGESVVKINGAGANRLFSDSRDLPTIDQLVENSQDLLLSSNDRVPASKPVSYVGKDFTGWWVPNLLVMKGEMDAMMVTCFDESKEGDRPVDGSAGNDSNSSMYKITKKIKGSWVSSFHSRERILSALKQRVAFLGPEEDLEKIDQWIGGWFDASGRTADPE